jgi:hypothetical protein
MRFRAQVGVSVAWAVYAAALVALGFWRRSAPTRWTGLAVFALTLAKVFLVDIARLSAAHRIGSFLVLGVLLVGASFLYQRSRGDAPREPWAAGGGRRSCPDRQRWTPFDDTFTSHALDCRHGRVTVVSDSKVSSRAIRIRAALVTTWFAIAVAGFAVLLRYDATPEATAAESRPVWPSDCGLAPLIAGRPTVVVFLHPKCPCSSATLDELETIFERVSTAADVRAVFVEPPGAPAEWTATELRARADRLAGLRVEDDLGGAESRRFGATTSGTTFVYDAEGRLLYRGGITRSRGHAGDNPGRRAVLALTTGADAETQRAPVFGCTLSDEEPTSTATVSR